MLAMKLVSGHAFVVHLTGIENRYRWVDPKTKKEGLGRIPVDDQTGRRYKFCKKCSSRVSIKLPQTVEECRYSGKTYSLPLKIRMQLTAWEVDEASGANAHGS